MSGFSLPRPQRRSRGITILPLINVVFLILIFFLVATRFAQEDRELDVELPSATEAKPMIASPTSTEDGDNSCPSSTTPVTAPARSTASVGMTPGCSAVSPPRSGHPAAAHALAIDATIALSRSVSSAPTAM